MSKHQFTSPLFTGTFTTSPEVSELPTANSRLGTGLAIALAITILLASLMLGVALFLLVLAITPVAVLGLWWVNRKSTVVDKGATLDSALINAELHTDAPTSASTTQNSETDAPTAN